jgi:hypothetical protein
MKALLLFATIAFSGLIAGSAHALPRPDVRKMTCRDAAGLVDANRAVVFTTGKYTYERIVSNVMSCFDPNREIEVPTYAKTLDNDRCFIGYTCRREDMAGNGSSIIGASAPIRCKEGKIRGSSRRTNDDQNVYERFQCRSGKWILLDI